MLVRTIVQHDNETIRVFEWTKAQYEYETIWVSVCANVQYGNVTIMKVCEKKMFSMRDRQSEGLCGNNFPYGSYTVWGFVRSNVHYDNKLKACVNMFNMKKRRSGSLCEKMFSMNDRQSEGLCDQIFNMHMRQSGDLCEHTFNMNMRQSEGFWE